MFLSRPAPSSRRRPLLPLPGASLLASPWLVTALLLAGCSGTPLGDRLSRSFPSTGSGASSSPPAPATPASPATAASPPSPVVPTSPVPSAAAKRPEAPGGRPAASAPGATSSSASSTATAGLERWLAPGTGLAPSTASAPSRPAPYRVTIRLPRADPAAPAEVVTRALRAAGVPFEVEMIERVQPVAGGAGSSAAPAGAPEVRQAPPPR